MDYNADKILQDEPLDVFDSVWRQGFVGRVHPRDYRIDDECNHIRANPVYNAERKARVRAHIKRVQKEKANDRKSEK